jgi:hypothetical protein
VSSNQARKMAEDEVGRKRIENAIAAFVERVVRPFTSVTTSTSAFASMDGVSAA